MALVTLPGVWWYGNVGAEPRANAPANQNLNDGTRQQIACVFPAPRAGTINRVLFGLSAAASVVNAQVSLTTVDASGNPNLPVTHYRVHAAADFTVNTIFRSGLLTTTGLNAGTKKTVTFGELMAVVLSWTGSPSGSSSLQWTTPDGTPLPLQNLHYQANYSGSAWSKQIISPRLALVYSDGSVVPVGWFFPQAQVATPNLSSSTTPDEVGLRFEMPFTGTLTQAALWTGALGGAPFSFRVYDEADTLLGSFSVAGTHEIQDTDSPVISHFDDILLERGSIYRFTALPGTTSNCTLGYFNINNYVLPAWPGKSQFYWTQRTDAGAWTDNVNRMPIYMLGFSAIDVPPAA